MPRHVSVQANAIILQAFAALLTGQEAFSDGAPCGVRLLGPIEGPIVKKAIFRILRIDALWIWR